MSNITEFTIPAKAMSSIALLIIDAHRLGDHSSSLDDFNHLQLKPSASKFTTLIQSIRELNMPIFHMREPHSQAFKGVQYSKQHRISKEGANNRGEVLNMEGNSHNLIDEWAPKPWEVVVDRSSHTTVWNMALHEQLLVWGITHLIIGGVTTQACTALISRELNDRGFEYCIVHDFIVDDNDPFRTPPPETKRLPQGLPAPFANIEDLISQIHVSAIVNKKVSTAGMADGWDGSLDLFSLRQAYKAGVSPVTVVMDVYKKIESHLSKTTSTFITITPQAAAISSAQDLLKKYPDRTSLPPLFGVPFSLKDNIDVAWMATTLACPPLAHVPTVSAKIYTKLVSLGAIFIGKTNMDQLATGMTGCRSPYGIPASVLNPLHIAGGSSSGAAVSVGAELVSFAIATDTAGSGRIPAGFNGIVGWKPTKGTVSLSGVAKACENLDCIAFMTTRRGGVRDAREIWKYVRGYDPDDLYSKPPGIPSPLRSRGLGKPGTSGSSFRFAVPPPRVMAECALVFCRLFSESVTKLQAAGGELIEVDWAPFEEAGRLLYDGALVNERLAAMPSSGKDWYQLHKENLHPVTREVFGSVLRRGNSAEDVFRDLKKMRVLTRSVHETVFNPSHASAIDVLLVPTAPNHPTIEEVLKDPISLNSVLGTFAHFGNVLDLCAVAVPAGWYDLDGARMPFSVTLLAGSGDDGRLLDLATVFERSVGTRGL